MATVVRGLEAALAFFGGVPSELLFDQTGRSRWATTATRADGRWRTGSSCGSPPAEASASGRAGLDRTQRRRRSSTRSASAQQPLLRPGFVSDNDLDARAHRWLDKGSEHSGSTAR